MKASQVLNSQMDWRGQGPISDAEIEADCDACGKPINLGACRTTSTDAGLLYRCKSCPETILIVSAFVEGTAAWPGRGYRLGPWVLRNISELRFRGVSIPASPNAAIDK